MRIHRVIVKNQEGACIQEIRFSNGTLYQQNRSKDIEICFDDFIDRLKITKKRVKPKGFSVLCEVVDNDVAWEKLKGE